MPKPWEEAVYHVVDRMPGEPLSLAGNLHLWRGIRHMGSSTALAASSITSAVFGMVAEVNAAPPQITWALVGFSAISFLSLVVRVAYGLGMRWIDHLERRAMIAQGLTPPPLAPYGKPKNPPPVPKEPCK